MDRLYALIVTPCAPLLSIFIRKPVVPLERRLDEILDKTEKTVDDLDVMITATENVIKQRTDKLKNPKLSNMERAKIRRELTSLVRTLKSYKSAQQKKIAEQENIAVVADTHRSLSDAGDSFVVMKDVQRGLKQMTRRFNPEDVSRVQEEIQSTIDLSNEVVDLLSTPLQTSSTYTVDESTLDAELQEILGVENFESILNPPIVGQQPSHYPVTAIPITVPSFPIASSSNAVILPSQ